MANDPESKVTSLPGAHFSWKTTEPVSWGYGWISGLLSALFGVLGLGAVICFHFPELTTPRLRPHYPVLQIRAVLHLLLVASFLLAIVSVCLRRNKALGVVGLILTLLAALLGGSQVALKGQTTDSPFLALDWFLLTLFAYSALYIPLERCFANRPAQPTFRPQWRLDLTYFFLNTLLVQFTTLLTMMPAMVLFDWARVPAIQELISALPLVIQVPVALLVADFAQYWIHRAFHTVPLLWRFHAIHHSAESLDWLAGSRLHLVDAVVTRAVTFIPISVLGFSETALYAYVAVVVVQATFIHANVRWEFPFIRRFVVTPRYHHWHHASELQAVDKNFSVHSPLWDWLFGTLHTPGRWPKVYGLCGRNDVPRSWVFQFLDPFWRRKQL